MPVKDARERLSVAGIILIASVMLIVNLGGKEFWSDEIFSLPKVNRLEVVLAQSAWDVHPPLFFVLEYYWIQVFGSGEFAARALSSLFGLAAVFIAFLLARRIIPRGNLPLYLIALATSPFFLFYSRMNRYYALTGLLCILVIYFYHRLLERPEWRREIPFWLSSLLLIYEDYVGFILLFSLAVSYLWHYRRNSRLVLRFIAGGVVIIILYLPWISSLLHQTAKGAEPYPEALPDREFRLAGWILYNAAQSIIRIGYIAFDFTLGETVFPWNPLILVGVIGAALLFFTAIKRGRCDGGFWTAILIFPFVIYIFAVIFYSRVFSASNFALIPSKILFLQPLWLMFLFRGGESRAKWIRGGAVILLTFNLVALVNYHRGTQFLNPKFLAPWKQIAVSLSAEAAPADVVVTDESPLLHYLRGKGVTCYGLVDADRFIAERPKPFKVYLTLRRRGQESIYLEGVKLKEILAEKYQQVDYIGYLPLKGRQKALWSRLLGEEFEYYLELYVFRVI